MQSLKQYGFRLEPDGNVTEESYLLLKRNIEKLCAHVERRAQQLEIDDVSFAKRIDSGTFLSVYTKDGITQFGIYHTDSKSITTSCNAKELIQITGYDFADFAMRCDNLMKSYAKGYGISLGGLEDAWRKERTPERSYTTNQTLGF